ncbi:TonB-dependent receptor [Cellvibrio sp. NN19]|uniref:TonB-dependent receptor n=1 Tax=Cellvibrio chitinivorans TaxID=3102792 RepID=UPI002B4119C9|nr:TonB-dependent receptor [Cellvibrio sp. NN19]
MSRFIRPASLLLTYGALLPSLAYAAEPAVEEVFVSASRTERPLSTIPNTVTVINPAELEQQLSIQDDLSTVLGNLIPGFSPSRQKMTNAGETLRGRKPLYMIDGVPQSNPLRDGGREGNTIDPSVIERVEVLHGANAIHGMGASGGVINLITKKPAAKLEQNIRLSTGFQTEDVSESADYGLSYNVSNRVGNADFIAGISLRDSGVAYDGHGDIIGADNTQGDTMDSESWNGFVKGGYDWDDQRVELMVNRYKVENKNRWISVPGNVAAGIPSSAVRGEIFGEGARNEVTAISLNYTNDDFLGHKLRIQGFSQDFAGTYGAEAVPLATFQDPAYGPDLIDQSQNNSEKLGAKITLVKDQIAGLPLNLVYGVDLIEDETWQELILTGRAWVPPTQYENTAPYMQAEFTGVDKLTLTAGVRHEESKLVVDDFTTLASYNGGQFVEGGSPEFSETLYNYGGTYQFTDALRVFANYAEAFSMPDVGRVLRGINQPNQSVESFLDLKPILTESTEFGVEFKTGDVTAQISYYASESNFGERLERDADGIYTVSRERTEIDGIELSTSWAATDVDLFGLRYAQATGRYDSNKDGKVDSDLGGTNISPDRANLSWDRSWSNRIDTRIQMNYLFDRDVKNASGAVTNSFDGYTTYDFNATLAALDGVFSFSVQNLTDEYYFTYYSQSSPNNIRNFTAIGRSFNFGYNRSF